MAEVKVNPCQTIEELSNTLNQPWSIIQEYLQQIGKVSRAGVWVPHNLSEENKSNRSTTFNSLLQRHNTEAFFDRLISGDKKWVLYDNLKRERQWLPTNEPYKVLLNQVYIPKRHFCVFGGVFAESFISKTVNADIYYK